MNLTANLDIFGTDRSINHLAVATVRDTLTGVYTAWYIDMPFILTQANSKEQATERLRQALMMYLNNICKNKRNPEA